MRSTRTITNDTVSYDMIVSEDVGSFDCIVAVQPSGDYLPLINGKSGKHLADGEYSTIKMQKGDDIVFTHHLDPTLPVKKGQVLSISFKVEPIVTDKGQPSALVGITVKVVPTEP